ncbi:MAG: hypothetical protein ABR608_03870, partial [Pseudonocardiaceae bacterium]
RDSRPPCPGGVTARHMCGVVTVFTEIAVLYLGLRLISVLAAVLVALASADRERRADARKVLQLLLSALPSVRRPHR